MRGGLGGGGGGGGGVLGNVCGGTRFTEIK